MQEQVNPLSMPVPPAPSARIWGTSTELGGTDKERKTYFLTIEDGDRRIQFSLQHFPAENKIVAEPYSPPDYDYTQYDNWDEDDEDEWDEETYYYDGDGEDNEPEEEEEEYDDTPQPNNNLQGNPYR